MKGTKVIAVLVMIYSLTNAQFLGQSFGDHHSSAIPETVHTTENIITNIQTLPYKTEEQVDNKIPTTIGISTSIETTTDKQSVRETTRMLSIATEETVSITSTEKTTDLVSKTTPVTSHSDTTTQTLVTTSGNHIRKSSPRSELQVSTRKVPETTNELNEQTTMKETLSTTNQVTQSIKHIENDTIIHEKFTSPESNTKYSTLMSVSNNVSTTDIPSTKAVQITDKSTGLMTTDTGQTSSKDSSHLSTEHVSQSSKVIIDLTSQKPNQYSSMTIELPTDSKSSSATKLAETTTNEPFTTSGPNVTLMPLAVNGTDLYSNGTLDPDRLKLVYTDEDTSDSFWPVVLALTIAIPSVIVFGVTITVLYRRRMAKPRRPYSGDYSNM